MDSERNPNLICRFYLAPGQGNEQCEASVNYRQLRDELNLKPLDLIRICMGRAEGCSKYQPFTAEELAIAEEADKERLELENLATLAIRKQTNGKKGQYGKMNCPACPVGTLQFSTAEHNAHITAKCSTPNCIDFRE